MSVLLSVFRVLVHLLLGIFPPLLPCVEGTERFSTPAVFPLCCSLPLPASRWATADSLTFGHERFPPRRLFSVFFENSGGFFFLSRVHTNFLPWLSTPLFFYLVFPGFPPYSFCLFSLFRYLVRCNCDLRFRDLALSLTGTGFRGWISISV